MSEQAPQNTQNEQEIHKTLEGFVDPSLGVETSQMYPHEQGQTRVLQGFGQEIQNLDGTVDTERTLTASNMQNRAQIYDEFDHRGFTTLRSKTTSTQPKGFMAKLRGEEPQVESLSTEAVVSRAQDARLDLEQERGNSIVKRLARTTEDENGRNTEVFSVKHTTHAAKGNKAQSYNVKFSSSEKEQQYGELVQKLALKGIKRAASKAHFGNRTLINRNTAKPRRAA